MHRLRTNKLYSITIVSVIICFSIIIFFVTDMFSWKKGIGIADFVNIFLALVTLTAVRYSKIAAESSKTATMNAINQTKVMEEEFLISHFPQLIPLEQEFSIPMKTVERNSKLMNDFFKDIIDLDESVEHNFELLTLYEPINISFFNAGGANAYYIITNFEPHDSGTELPIKEGWGDNVTLVSNKSYIKYYKMFETEESEYHELFYLKIKVQDYLEHIGTGIYSTGSNEKITPLINSHALEEIPIPGLNTFYIIETALNLLPGPQEKHVMQNKFRFSIRYKTFKQLEKNLTTRKIYDLEIIASSIKIFDRRLNFKVNYHLIDEVIEET